MAANDTVVMWGCRDMQEMALGNGIGKRLVHQSRSIIATATDLQLPEHLSHLGTARVRRQSGDAAASSTANRHVATAHAEVDGEVPPVGSVGMQRGWGE